MSARGVNVFAQADLPDCHGPYEESVVEIPLLLPNWQAEALEDTAHRQGLTAGELIRQLLLDYLARHAVR